VVAILLNKRRQVEQLHAFEDIIQNVLIFDDVHPEIALEPHLQSKCVDARHDVHNEKQELSTNLYIDNPSDFLFLRCVFFPQEKKVYL
jgi:hypothetical protein